MYNVLIHKVNELRPETRTALEAELGRSLGDDEDVSIMAFSMHEAPTGEARAAAAKELKAYLSKIDRRAVGASGEETDSALNEALQDIRPGYRERE
jgi:hypothetical protein